jgi:hypothetical protein
LFIKAKNVPLLSLKKFDEELQKKDQNILTQKTPNIVAPYGLLVTARKSQIN